MTRVSAKTEFDLCGIADDPPPPESEFSSKPCTAINPICCYDLTDSEDISGSSESMPPR